MNYLMQGFGVFLGVLAGTAVTVLANWLQQRRDEKQQVRNLKFELGELNIRKINRWIEEVERYRNAVNGDSLQQYFGYFDLSRIVSATANDMFQRGLLYKYLSHDQIGKLQAIYSEFSLTGEQYINSQIAQNKALFSQSLPEGNWVSNFKAGVVQNVEFWDRKFREHRDALQEIAKSLE